VSLTWGRRSRHIPAEAGLWGQNDGDFAGPIRAEQDATSGEPDAILAPLFQQRIDLIVLKLDHALQPGVSPAAEDRLAATALVTESGSWNFRSLNQGGRASIRNESSKIKRPRWENRGGRKSRTGEEMKVGGVFFPYAVLTAG
jgi:hypothetical protein